jgi:hypothetical protein
MVLALLVAAMTTTSSSTSTPAGRCRGRNPGVEYHFFATAL